MTIMAFFVGSNNETSNTSSSTSGGAYSHVSTEDGAASMGDLELQPMSIRNRSKQSTSSSSQSENDSAAVAVNDFNNVSSSNNNNFDDDDDDLEERMEQLQGPLLQDHNQPPNKIQPKVYPQRWIQLGYLSLLALLSDWICFSTASNPEAFEEAYPGHSSSDLIDKFLFMNVISCFLVTDVVAQYGLDHCVKAASILMAVGCWLRSGLGIVPVVFELCGIRPISKFDMGIFGLTPYPMLVVGTLMVGAAQPFFQCTPPLLSAQWFASDERATSTAIALNFNQVGIATAFLVGGKMMDTTDDHHYGGIMQYFALIAVLCTVASVGTILQFQHLPPIPPSASEFDKLKDSHREPPFHVSVRSFFQTPGFARPLAAFICSIAITNVVGAFIDEVMERGGVTDRDAIAWAGVGFEMMIVFGGIVLGKYVDVTKSYKCVTLVCIALSLLFLIPLGLTEHRIGKEPVLLVISLFMLGFFVGPVQPINAELAVDVTYPGDETAVESVQQIGGNLISALLVPLAERAAKKDFQILPNIPALAGDIRGDVVMMLAVSLGTFCFFSGFNAPLRRTLADGD